jgi:hypothetical protein
MKRKFFAESVLVAFEGVDLGNAEVECIGKPDDLGPTLQDQLKLGIAGACRSHHKLRVEVPANDLPDSVICVRPANYGAVPAIIGGDS